MVSPAPDKAVILEGLSHNLVELIGVSFILGSLFTILILIILDWMKSRRKKAE